MNRLAVVAVALLLSFVAASLTACTPAAGQQAIPYLAAPSEIISTVAQFGPFLELGRGYDFPSIETIGDGYITLVAPVMTGVQVMGVLGGLAPHPPLRITITTFEQPEATTVAVSVTPVQQRSRIVEMVLRELDMRFRRAG
jgi:hypothetical protein